MEFDLGFMAGPTGEPVNVTFELDGTTVSVTLPFTKQELVTGAVQRLPFLMSHIAGISTLVAFLFVIGFFGWLWRKYPSESFEIFEVVI